jgi:hypothetical protein
LSSATETTTGDTNFTVPGSGTILLNTGRIVVGADGSLEFRMGSQDFIDRFVDGDPSVWDALCADLGAA